MSSISSSLLPSTRRIQLTQCKSLSHNLQQTRNATLIKRPKRPYTFTQLVTLTDGSAYLQRTTSPTPVYRSNKDVRNTTLWNPSNEKLANMEDDDAGKLRAFRSRFGRSWDLESAKAAGDDAQGDAPEPNGGDQSLDLLMDLISGNPRQSATKAESKPVKVEKSKKK